MTVFIRSKEDGTYGVLRFVDGPMSLVAYAGGRSALYVDNDSYDVIDPGEILVRDVMLEDVFGQEEDW